MNRRAWSSRVVLRYALLQVPALALLVLLLILVQKWVDLPTWFIYALIAFWVAKDVILFFFTWRAYDQDSNRAVNSMVGARGITKDRLAPLGYVRVHGELWQAEVVQNSPPIEREKVCGFMEIVDSLCSCRATIKKVVEPKVTFTELKKFVNGDYN